jgi:DNA polymerase-3 subunit epsilon
LSVDGETITLKKFHGRIEVPAVERDPATESTCLVLDVETTGFDRHNDAIIELAVAKLRYCRKRRIVVAHEGTWDWFQDPGRSIPDEIVAITGITDEMVSGQEIPEEAETLLEEADLIVAHNASFDLGFCLKRWPIVDDKAWACSWKQIDWHGHGFPVAKQEMLCRFHGFFFDAHRADADIEALATLLMMSPGDGSPSYFSELLDEVRRERFRVRAVGTPFDAKDDLKARGYRWDAELRHWWTEVDVDEMPAEQEWLDALYERYNCGAPRVEPIKPGRRWHPFV